MRTTLVLLTALAAGCAPAGAAAGLAAADLACPFDDGLAYDPGDPYPFCQRETDGWERYCRPSSTGWSYMLWRTDADGTGALCRGGTDCNTCACTTGCRPDTPWPGASPDAGPGGSPCPAPSSGTATPTCLVPLYGGGFGHDEESFHNEGFCALLCENGETCPDGMRCVSTAPEDGAIHHCAWVVAGERCSL